MLRNQIQTLRSKRIDGVDSAQIDGSKDASHEAPPNRALLAKMREDSFQSSNKAKANYFINCFTVY